MRTCLTLILLLGAAWLTHSANIVEHGQAQAQIVIAETPTRMSRFAAGELQHYIAKLTGAELPITSTPSDELPVRLYVGPSAEADALGLSAEGLDHDAYRLQSGDTWLAFIGQDANFVPSGPHGATRSRALYNQVLAEWDEITGDTFGNPFLKLHSRHLPELDIWDIDQRGTLNAVYGYLRSLGVRWYFPGDLGEILPESRQTLPLPQLAETVIPDFAVRSYRFGYEHLGLTEDLVRWQLRLGTNYGHELIGLSLPGHGTKFVYTRDEMKEAHPEFYALWNGKRATDHRECGAPCLSHPGLYAKNLHYARALFDTYDDRMLSADVCDGYAWLCKCDLCAGKDDLGRGWRGVLSNYVWGHVNRLAIDLLETHPDRMVSGLSYSTYRLPPSNLEQLAPNVAAIICQSRGNLRTAEAHQQEQDLRQSWIDKLPSDELYIWDYYFDAYPSRPLAGVPVMFPQRIGTDLRSLVGVSKGDLIEVYSKHSPDQFEWHALATNHLNLYVTARLWWDADQDLDALLGDYYRLYYGPAAGQMQAFVEYAEEHYHLAPRQVEVIDTLFAHLAAAQAAAGDSVYGERIQLIATYMERLQPLRDKLAIGRENVPTARALRRSPAELTLDGKLDDPFWESVRPYRLQEVQTGQHPAFATVFQPAWGHDDALYFAIRCEDADMDNLNVATKRPDDMNIWLGDCIEILIETQQHTYYQIAINPAGVITDLDRSNGLNAEWTANAQAAVSRDDRGWTIELRLPVAGEEANLLTPDAGISGAPPTPTYRWYMNVCRQRVRGDHTELSAWSPTGIDHFHNLKKLGELYVK